MPVLSRIYMNQINKMFRANPFNPFKMMRTIKNTSLLLLLLVVSLALPAQAQVDFSIGPKVGFSLNRFTEVETPENIRFESFNTFSGGLFARAGFKKVYLQPEAYFLIKGSNYSFLDQTRASGEIRMNAIDAPILLGFHIVKLPTFNFRVFAGPVLNLYLDEYKNDLETVSSRQWDFMANKAHSLQGGIGIDVLMLTLDARYEQSISQINKEMDIHHRQISFSLGYKFL